MSVLILVEHNGISLADNTRNLITAAQQLSPEVTALIIGDSGTKLAEMLASYDGIKKVISASSSQSLLAEIQAQIIYNIAQNYQFFVAAASTYGKNCMPRLAAKLDVTQISDVTKVLSNNTFEHPIYAGNAIEQVKVLDPKIVLTIRATAFEPNKNTQDSCPIEEFQADYSFSKVKFISHKLSSSDRPELSSAAIVVSGGRGLQSSENFKIIEQLADKLGAAVGASRAAVDAGFVSNDYQVGQTGKIVAPKLYIAIGISGAIQHLAGMKDAKIVVSINKDADAPIFQYSDYYLVGDLFEIVPELINNLQGKQ